MDDYRFYSFVAGLYLSELQKGLQTAHVVSEVYANHNGPVSRQLDIFDEWADRNKRIIILNAQNSKGVIEVHRRLMGLAPFLNLPFAIFNEDEDSLNGAATACGVIVPKELFDVKYIPADPEAIPDTIQSRYRYLYQVANEDGLVLEQIEYMDGSREYEFISLIKGYKLA